jgi:hypothetical protein
MHLDFSPEDLAFQQYVRSFIAENYPAELQCNLDNGPKPGADPRHSDLRRTGSRHYDPGQRDFGTTLRGHSRLSCARASLHFGCEPSRAASSHHHSLSLGVTTDA